VTTYDVYLGLTGKARSGLSISINELCSALQLCRRQFSHEETL